MRLPCGPQPRHAARVLAASTPCIVDRPSPRSRASSLRCMSQNGTAEHDTRRMFVADLDMSSPLVSSSLDMPSTSARPVSVPSNNVAVGRCSGSGKGAAEWLGTDAASVAIAARPLTPGGDSQLVKDNRALKEELLRAKTDLAVQTQEVLELRGKIAERDRSLQLTKSELIETRITLQEKEEQLQEAYERLRKATNERAEFRRYLTEAEQELRTTRAELLEWSQGLLDLKQVMEGLDDDLSELVGTSTYAAAMSEIEDTLRHTGDGPSSSGPLDDLGRMSLDQAMSDDEMDDIAEALRGLQELSRQILEEAKEDTEYFS